MSATGRRGPPPHDSPDLSWVMAAVTGTGGLSAFTTRRSVPGLAAGLAVAALFGLGGLQIASARPEGHEVAHQACLVGSVLFAGAMGYRAANNPYVGPGGSMLAALGACSSAYHLVKMVEWRAWEQARLEEAERLLRQHHVPLPPPFPLDAQQAQQHGAAEPRRRGHRAN